MKKYPVCRLKNYMQIKELSVDWRFICRSSNYALIEVQPLDQRSILSLDQKVISRSKMYSICRSKNHLQIKKHSIWSADWRNEKICADSRSIPSPYWQNVCRLKDYLQFDVQSANGKNNCRSKNILQNKVLRTICKLNYLKYVWIEHALHLQIR